MKKLFITLLCVFVSTISFAQRNIPGFVPNTPFRGWGGMFNFIERGFEPVFNLNTFNSNQTKVYISDIPEFEKPFSRKRVNVITFEIPDSTGIVLLRFYGVNETIEMLKTIKSVMEECSTFDKISVRKLQNHIKGIKKVIPKSACFWDNYAGFNNKIEPTVILLNDADPIVILQGVSYCRIKFKDLSTIIDPNFSGDKGINCEIQLSFDSIDEINRMIERLNFMMNIPSHRMIR